MDSRLELALAMSGAINNSLAYWLGKDIITNGTKEDVECVNKITEALHLPKQVYDVSVNYRDCLENVTKENCLKYGEYASIYACNPKWFQIFEMLSSDIDFIVFGFFGETLRTLAELDHSFVSTYTVRDFIEKVYCRNSLEKSFFSLPGFYESLEKAYHKITGKPGTKILDIQEPYEVFTCSRYESDSIRTNFANMFTYSFSVLSQKSVQDISRFIPYEWKKGDYFSTQLTKFFCPLLLQVPFFSHHHYIKYDDTTKTTHEIQMDNVKHALKTWFSGTLLDTIYHRYFQKLLHPRTRDNQMIIKVSLEYLLLSGVIKGSKIKIREQADWTKLEVPTLATATADVKVIDVINSLE